MDPLDGDSRSDWVGKGTAASAAVTTVGNEDFIGNLESEWGLGRNQSETGGNQAECAE